jgi:hypothetical protein
LEISDEEAKKVKKVEKVSGTKMEMKIIATKL